MFGSRISTKSLAQLCRSLGTLLHSGVDVKKSFQLAAEKTYDPRARKALARISLDITHGLDITESMRSQGNAFPDLVIDMVSVAEQSGALPEILDGLAEHYENIQRLRRTFLAAVAWPVIQLLLAIFLIAGAIWVMGIIKTSFGDSGFDMIGLGLSGAKGAMIWLAATLGPLLGLVLGYKLLTGSLSGKRFLDPLLMLIPVVGPCMRSFAIARFSWAYYLTQQTGMPMKQSLKASLRATANGAFMSRTKIIVDRVQSGENLTDALSAARIFPADFLHMVSVGETSGTVPETLHRLSPQFEEQARRSLKGLAVAASLLVWMTVAAFIIFLIFRIFLNYLDMLEQAGAPI